MATVDTSPEAVCPFEGCEQIVYNDYLQKLGLHRAFVCYDVKEEMEYLSSMVLTKSHFHLVRMMPRKNGYAYVVYQKALVDITMITARTNYPEVITITYGNPNSEEPGASSSDRFFIPDADIALYILKRLIIRAKKVTGKGGKAPTAKSGKRRAAKSATTSSAPEKSKDEDLGTASEATGEKDKPAEDGAEKSAAESPSEDGTTKKPEEGDVPPTVDESSEKKTEEPEGGVEKSTEGETCEKSAESSSDVVEESTEKVEKSSEEVPDDKSSQDEEQKPTSEVAEKSADAEGTQTSEKVEDESTKESTDNATKT